MKRLHLPSHIGVEMGLTFMTLNQNMRTTTTTKMCHIIEFTTIYLVLLLGVFVALHKLPNEKEKNIRKSLRVSEGD